MIIVYEYFIYRLSNKESRGLCIIFRYFRIGFALQTQIKAKLDEYRYEKNWLNKHTTVCPCTDVLVGFFQLGRVRSYNLWRHILHTHSKNILFVLQTDCTFLLFLFKWIQRREKNILNIYLFIFILDTGLNSHAYTYLIDKKFTVTIITIKETLKAF